MLEAVGGIVIVLNLLIALVIGARLLRLGHSTGGPEIWLGAYFLLYPFLASMLSCGLYMGWSDPSLALPPKLEASLNAAFFAISTVGAACLLTFTRRIFRPEAGWAGGLVWAGSGVLAAGALAIGATDGYRVVLLPGAAYWMVVVVRELVFVWMAAESLHYWGLLRRRLRLGLADPLVTNRFLLWSVWALSVFGLGLSDPIARLWYYHLAGSTTVWVPEAGRPIVLWSVGLTSLLGIGVATTLFLTFFPTEGFRRWVLSRAPSTVADAD
jgi:hypothetical protein